MTSSDSNSKHAQSKSSQSQYASPYKTTPSSSPASVQLRFNPPKYQTNPASVTASTYFQQALNAYNASQWHEAIRLAQACIAVAQHEMQYLIRAKNLYAAALMNINEKEQALAVWLDIIKSVPKDAGMLANIGMILIKLERTAEAIEYFQRSIQIRPLYSTYVNLGFACYQNGDVAQAKASYQQALLLDPNSIQARLNLVEVYKGESLYDEGQQLLEQAIKIDPHNLAVLGGTIRMEQFRYPLNMVRQTEYLQHYAQTLEGDRVTTSQHQNPLTHHTPLRVGFVSADLRANPVGYFLENTLAQLGLDPELRDRLVLIAYHNTSTRDAYTERLQTHFEQWHQVDTWDDARLIEQIQQDCIDILIDLSGHTTKNRLPVFARKAAPVQMSWLGYFGSTGLSSMDYVLADPICVPADEAHWFVEKIWRLPRLRYCLSIPDDAPDVSSSPCIHNQDIVLGCYQTLPKINQGVIRCWARILSACPHTRLRLQSKELSQGITRDRFIARLEESGIDVARVELVGAMTRRDYLASYAEVDILLDTFPYTGGTTTAEALWMGVPTLTLALPSMLGRQGEALMVNAGLSDWVAYSEEEYVQKAIYWANADVRQRQQLGTLRAEMRERVRHSPVFDTRQFAQDLVSALYGMWWEKWGEYKQSAI